MRMDYFSERRISIYDTWNQASLLVTGMVHALLACAVNAAVLSETSARGISEEHGGGRLLKTGILMTRG